LASFTKIKKNLGSFIRNKNLGPFAKNEKSGIIHKIKSVYSSKIEPGTVYKDVGIPIKIKKIWGHLQKSVLIHYSKNLGHSQKLKSGVIYKLWGHSHM
jgi:hypothetical protein